MKILLMGCGSIGERHAMNLRSILPNMSLDIFDLDPSRLRRVLKKYSARSVDETAIDSVEYDCVFICTPPSSHIGLAVRALKVGSNVFIEKPLSSKVYGLKKLQCLIRDTGLLAFVGYNLRFNKGISMVKKKLNDGKLGRIIHASAYFGQYLPDWRPWQDYTKSYTARRELGGGIILDSSHEMDYLIWLFGSPSSIQAQFAYTDILSVNTEAIADVLLKFENGTLGYIHLDFLRRKYRRTLEVLCENGLIQWSLPDSRIKIYDPNTKLYETVKHKEMINDMYLAEITHVIKCIDRNVRSEVIDLENGITTLLLSEAIRRSSLQGRRLSV
jgi:predicted dehydrogenase